MAENWYQALGRGLIDLGKEAPKLYQDYQDSRWKEIDRGNQIEDMIQKRTAYQQEQARKEWEFKQKQEAEKKVQDALKALNKNQDKFEQQKAEYERKQAKIESDRELLNNPIIHQGAQALAKQSTQGQQQQQLAPEMPIEGQLPEQNVNAMDSSGIANQYINDRSQQIDQEFRNTEVNRLNQALPDLTSGLNEYAGQEPELQQNTEQDYLNAYLNTGDNRFLNVSDRVQGGRYDQTGKGGLTFEQKMQLEQAKEDLRNNRPLTEWQKSLLQNMNKNYELNKESLGVRKEGLGIRKENLKLAKEDQKRQGSTHLTSFVKNTKDQAEILYAFQSLDKLVPGGIYGKGGIAGYGFGTKPLRKFWKTEEANAIRPGIQALINKVLKQRSGAAVTDQELNRLETEFGINTTGTVEEFRQGLRNFYEGVKNDYDRFVTADPEAASRIDRQGYGDLQNTPKIIQQQRPQQPIQQTQTIWTDAKAKRLAELRAKQAAGRLR